MQSTFSLHRELQLARLAEVCEADARLNFRCAKRADSIKNRSAAAHFRARATKSLRIATLAGLRAGT